MPYLFDTNIFIAAIKGQPEVAEKLAGIPANELLLSSIVLGELEFGVEKSAYPERNRTRIFEIASKIELVGLNANTCFGLWKNTCRTRKSGDTDRR